MRGVMEEMVGVMGSEMDREVNREEMCVGGLMRDVG